MTDPFDAAAAAGHQLEQQLAAAQQALSAETAKEQADQATIAADEAQITELENELHPTPPPPPPPPPVPSGPVHGINATSAAQHATQTQVWGLPRTPWAWRYYLQKDEALHLPTEYAVGPAEQLVISWPMPSSLNPTQAQLAAFFGQFPTDRDWFFIFAHEHDAKIRHGLYTAAQYRASFHTVRLAQQQVGNPHIKLVSCFTGYEWDPHSGSNVENDLPADPDYDYITSDTYFNGGAGQIGSDISTASAQFDKQIATAKAHGKSWGITETGVGQGLSGQARLDALTLLFKTIKQKQAILDLYFDMGQSTDSWWLDPAGVAAVEAGRAA